MSADYKSAKEAFVADNPGESIWSIQLTSLAALAAYVLYAVMSRRARGPVLDYATTVLPLLLGVTLLSGHPIALIGSLLALAALAYSSQPRPPSAKAQSATRRSQGEWLEESDSDEEPSQPVYASATSIPASRLSTSSAAVRPTSSGSVSPVGPLTIKAPTGHSADHLDTPEHSKRTFKRRHSPTPSTHTHTAIEIVPTPETDTFAIPDNPAYPPHPRARQHAQSGRAAGQNRAESGKLPFLSVYRAHMMIMTIHCILAVDFPVFPRYQGKCEDFGTSLMDVGVGSFVFSLGLVSSRSASNVNSRSMLLSILTVLKKASPVLLLGLVRVLMVKGTEYPEHVTEYGVHWNFFFTLGLLPVLGILLSPLQRYIGWTPLALLVTTCHHFSLSLLGLQTWVLSLDRQGLVGMNKEGIVSLPGYLAIYALGLGIGQHILRGPLSERKDERDSSGATATEHLRAKLDKRRTECALELFGYSIGWWVLLLAARMSGEQVSRRMANLPYVLWTAAYNTTFLLGYLAVEIAFFPSVPSSTQNATPDAVPPLLEAINKNGLAVFLAANLATGLVNISMETMYAGDTKAMVVLIAYSAAICALGWSFKGVRLKI